MGFYPPPTSIPIEPKQVEPVELDENGLPVARLLSEEPSERQVRWTLRLVFFVLIILALICAIGPHIPAPG